MKNVISIFIVAVVFFTVGLSVGVKQGIANYFYLESILAGHLATGYARKAGSPTDKNLANVQWYIDEKIDRGMDGYISFIEEGNKLLAAVFLKEHFQQYEASAKVLASYRNEFPEENISRFLGDSAAEYQLQFDKRQKVISELLE